MAQLGTIATVEELAAMFGVQQTTDAIFSESVLNDNNPNFNKWSKHKPIHHSQSSPLWDRQNNDDSKFRGMSTDHAQGIYYGLKAGVANPTAANIHAANWAYVGRPQGGTSSWHRIDDFWGYEKDAKYPTLSGSGLANGQEAIYTNNTNITTTLTRSSLTSIVDVAEVFGGQLDYTKLYLVVLVGNYARAMICADTGTISPINSNGQENKTFHFPDMSGIINTNNLPMTVTVSVFLVDNNAIGTFRNSWVDMTTAVNLGNKPITLPFQVGLSMTFKSAGKIYITAFGIELVTDKGTQSIVASFTNGPDWDEADAYRVLYNITSPSGARSSASYSIDKYDFIGAATTSQISFLDDVMKQAGFVKGSSTANYTIQGDFQVDEGSGFKTTGYMKTITVNW